MNRLQALREAKAATMTGQGPLAPGVIQVRLTGGQDDIFAVASVLAAVPSPGGSYRPGRPLPEPAPGLGTGSTSLCGSPRHPPPTPKPSPPRWKDIPMTTDPAAAPDPKAETADPDIPIPYTLTSLAETFLDGLSAERGLREPEPEAGL